MSSNELKSLLDGRPSATPSQSDEFSVLSRQDAADVDMVGDGGGLLSGETRSNKREFLSVMIESAAASSSSNGSAALSPGNAPFSILLVTQYMLDHGLVCGGIIGSWKEDGGPKKVCVKPSCDVAKHKTLKDEALVGDRFYLTRGRTVYSPEKIFCELPKEQELVDKGIAVMEEINEAFVEAPSGMGLGSAWIAFEEFKARIKEVCLTSGIVSGLLENNKSTLNNIQSEVDLRQLLSSVTSVQNDLYALKAENQQLKAELSKVKSSSSAYVVRLSALEEAGTGGGGEVSRSEFEALREVIKGVKHELLLQDSRAQSNALVCGNVTIKSYADCLLFVFDNFKVATHGLHHDFPSLLESCNTDAVNSKDYADTEHSAMKSKFLNYAEITTGASFQRVVPAPLGGGGSNSQIKSHSIDKLLGNMRKRSDWISEGGTEGLKPALETELRYKEQAIAEELAMTHGDSLGYTLGMHYLKDAYNFATKSFVWTESFYVELCGLSQGVTSEEAWNLICQCWLHMFLDFRTVRASCANNSVAGLDADSPLRKERVARYIWAMGQCNQLQNQFIEKGFRGHPTISAVINYHLYKYRVPTSVHKADIALLTQRLEVLNTWKGQAVRTLAKLEKATEKKQGS